MEQPPEQPPPVEVPADQLAAETLRAVVEAFVLREGTDYGRQEASLDAKVAQVLRQLEHGDAQILFDPATETIDIVPTVRSGMRRL
jgi:uncharacterized protein YheU (UPF0270 family)